MSQGLSGTLSMAAVGGQHFFLLGEKNPCPVYPASRQSKSCEESLRPAVVGLDYKIVGDFFWCYLVSNSL